MRTPIAATIALILLAAAPAFAQSERAPQKKPTPVTNPGAGGADLRWRPQEGQSFIYELHQKSTNQTVTNPPPASKSKPSSKQPANSTNAAIDSTLDQTLTLELTVKSSDKELGSTVELKITRVRATITTPDASTTVDSNQPANPSSGADPIALALTQIAGTTLTLTVEPNGNITKSEGGGETLGLTSLLGDGGAALPKDALGLISSSSSTPPRVKVGQRWTTTSSLAGSLLGDAAVTTTHTLKKLKGSDAEVQMQGSMEPAPRDKGTSPAASLFKVTSATTSGTYHWDTTLGWITSLSMSQRTRIEAEGLGEALGESRTMESTSETTLTKIR